jgi:hypothetical protein
MSQNTGSRITVNGKTWTAPPGSTLSVNNGVVFIDGKKVDDFDGKKVDTISIQIEGDVLNIHIDGNVTVHGNVHGDVDAKGSVTCQNVGGGIRCGGSVQCGDVGGDIDCGGSAKCSKVCGGVKAGGAVMCTAIGAP